MYIFTYELEFYKHVFYFIEYRTFISFDIKQPPCSDRLFKECGCCRLRDDDNSSDGESICGITVFIHDICMYRYNDTYICMNTFIYIHTYALIHTHDEQL